MGLCNQELDLLGCWKPQESTTYVRTVHRQVSTVQEYVRREVESGTASNALDEEADVINIMAWMREAGISVMEPEPQAAVVKRGRASTPKIMQLPIKEQRRSFLNILTQGHYAAIDLNTGHRRLPA